jgi:hypothetical protein
VEEERKRVGVVRGREVEEEGKWRWWALERGVSEAVVVSGGEEVRVGRAGVSEAMDWRRRRRASCWGLSADAIFELGRGWRLGMWMVDGLVVSCS